MAMMVPPQMNPKYKTSLCKHWTTTGNCSIGSRCHFAHGERELRNPNDVFLIIILNSLYHNYQVKIYKIQNYFKYISQVVWVFIIIKQHFVNTQATILVDIKKCVIMHIHQKK